MEYIEVTGKTVEDALTEALVKLETTSDKVDYEIIDKGSKGFLGIGGKPAVIKVWLKENEEKSSQSDNKLNNNTVNTEEKTNTDSTDNSEITDSSDREEKSSQRHTTTMPKEEIESRINTFLNDMFKSMEMQVTITITYDEKNDIVNVDLSGENMGVLIGKRGQTLDSIQYLTSLVVNKGDNKYVRIKLDTEDYRNRRKETLESLAKNIAYKVKRSRRSVSLEPMNPYERRIIHAALQNDKYVSTKSEGEDPFRHVVVYLDKEKNPNK